MEEKVKEFMGKMEGEVGAAKKAVEETALAAKTAAVLAGAGLLFSVGVFLWDRSRQAASAGEASNGEMSVACGPEEEL